MPIASYKPETEPLIKQDLPKIEPNEYQSIVIDDRTTPIKSLIAYIEGAPWSVNYYSQIITKDNDLREIDPSQSNIYQQYQKIKDLELRVSSSLSDSYDSVTGISSVTGNGLFYPVIAPNINDYFTAEAGDSRTGIFKITDVERKTFNRNSAFYIEYTMIGYIESSQSIYAELESKTIRTYYFSKDRLVDGLQPLLKEHENKQVLDLNTVYFNMVNYYFKTFFSRKYMTLVLPGQDYGIYDSFLTDYILKIVDSFDAYEIRNIKQLPTDNEKYLEQSQFWSLLYNRDYDGLNLYNKKMGLVHKYAFNKNTYIKGLACSNIDYVLYPILPDETINSSIDTIPKVIALAEMIDTKNIKGENSDTLLSNIYIDYNRSYPYIYKVLSDEYYVLSQSFYDNDTDQSLLEILTKDYMKKLTINNDKLISLCSQYTTWPRLEQYYYLPILLTLIKDSIKNSYS